MVCVNFPIYTTYEDVCERLLSSLVDDCYLSNFEVHYSLHPEKLVERQIDVTTDQIIRTAMFHQIRAQFSMTDTVVVTNHDYKQLLSEVINKINMKLRIQEGFGSSLQDPTVLERLLDQQLPFKQVNYSFYSALKLYFHSLDPFESDGRQIMEFNVSNI